MRLLGSEVQRDGGRRGLACPILRRGKPRIWVIRCRSSGWRRGRDRIDLSWGGVYRGGRGAPIESSISENSRVSVLMLGVVKYCPLDMLAEYQRFCS